MWGYIAIALAATIALLIAIIYARGRALKKIRGQSAVYAMAMRRAGETGKPLAVFGDPTAPKTLNARYGAGYGCGDVCIDLNGAPGCATGVKSSILDWLLDQADNSAVIFESEVLEYIPDKELSVTLSEMRRVSGGDLFASHSNVIDSATYADTGELQPVRAFDVFRMRYLMGDTVRRVKAFPPFHNYEWA
jgi:hypothetical protein